ncbi:MAG: hypoxanthine phosphoribosyltransferase [Bacteroidia bacterium]|jgi:hypoxanthine phosphoribosyltransferase
MSSYQQQVNCLAEDIDIGFWKAPQGVSVPDDELNFLLVPDAVESRAIFELCSTVHEYQSQRAAPSQQTTQSRQANYDTPITCALIATMGGMLPGILAYDHLVQGRPQGTPKIEFGTIGVSLYKGPNERYDAPVVQQNISIPIEGETVLVIDDLGDRGGTLQFLKQYIADKGAAEVLTLALYMKPEATRVCPADFFFGAVEQDIWIITPRETVETMVKRVPVWQERGANMAECRRRLVDLIGYPASLADYYLPGICGDQ